MKNVKESPLSDTKQESVIPGSKSKTYTKTRPKKLSGSTEDLSSDFNQF